MLDTGQDLEQLSVSQQKKLEEQRRQIRKLQIELSNSNNQLTEVVNSNSWRITAPLRFIRHHIITVLDKAVRRAWRLRKLLARKTAPANKRPQIAFISHNINDPGHIYRVERLRKALDPYFDTSLHEGTKLEQGMNRINAPAILWIWRMPMTPWLEQTITEARENGAKIIFDVDDMCFHPDHYSTKLMDAIRYLGLDTDEMKDYASALLATARSADFCTATTVPLARELYGKTLHHTFLLRNTWDDEYRQTCLEARRKWLATRKDDYFRIGYAAGSHTHQADFAEALPAIIAVLRANPRARLVLFKTVSLDDFGFPNDLQARVEWRDIVPLYRLPDELARFDVNLAPLEHGNHFCNCKSELKFFETALMGIPTIASPTEPFAAAIENGVSGFLCDDAVSWQNALERLLADPDLAKRMGRAARRAVAWRFGPDYLQMEARAIVEYVLGDARQRALLHLRSLHDNAAIPPVPDYDVVYSTGPTLSRVSVIIPLYNYGHYIVETLESLAAQSLQDFDVIVVNDASTDNSEEVARKWLEQHEGRFATASLLRNRQNSGLSMSRNAGIDYSDSEFVMLLDADNILLPDCLAQCLALIESSPCAFVYPKIEFFGCPGKTGHTSMTPWDPLRLQHGNYIDAMAMVRKSCWAAVGGYDVQEGGWEDFDFWCKMAEHGFYGLNTPQVLARYRVHDDSMLISKTNSENILPGLKELMARKHPWLMLGDGNDTC